MKTKVHIPITVETVQARGLKPSYIDKKIHVISDDFHKGHLYSRLGEKKKKSLPY